MKKFPNTLNERATQSVRSERYDTIAFGDLSNRTFTDTNFRFCKSDKANNLYFENCRLSYFDFGNLSKSSFEGGTVLEHILCKNYNYCKFEDCKFLSCNFMGSKFKNCTFDNVRFEYCAFKNTKFENCTFDNCDFGMLRKKGDFATQTNCTFNNTVWPFDAETIAENSTEPYPNKFVVFSDGYVCTGNVKYHSDIASKHPHKECVGGGMCAVADCPEPGSVWLYDKSTQYGTYNALKLSQSISSGNCDDFLKSIPAVYIAKFKPDIVQAFNMEAYIKTTPSNNS